MACVDILSEGYARMVGEDKMEANCTSVLIRSSAGNVIVVDTMTPWDGDHLKSQLARFGVTSPDMVTHVVCTHGHSDHTGCNGLFLEAKAHVVGHSVSHRHTYTLHPFDQGRLLFLTLLNTEF